VSSRYVRRRRTPHHVQDGYEAQGLYNGDSAIVIASTVRAGKAAPPHHLHEHSDQLYYVTEGEMHVQLGQETFQAGPDTLVYIPRGTPHHNWNAGTVDELHFEVLSPVPFRTQPISTPTDSTDAGGRNYVVRHLEEVGLSQVLPGFCTARLLQRSDGSDAMALYVAEVAPGHGGPGMHVHDFDQFYYVLEGRLSMQIGLQQLEAGPHELVVLPAGVPHRQCNNGDVRERHITLLVPEPRAGQVWDRGVELHATGIDH
jgi:mannose-6-phosphate isomerase-like protein (cupin superfamily)